MQTSNLRITARIIHTTDEKNDTEYCVGDVSYLSVKAVLKHATPTNHD